MKYPFVLPIIGIVLIAGLPIAHAADAPAPLHDLGEPKRTQIVATLDTKIEDGKNAVWCASFVAAWKHLQNDLAGGMVALDGARDMWLKLNAAPNPGQDIPPSALYATAGFEDSGIRQTILKEVSQRFPGSRSPALPDPILQHGFIAYARLEAAATFPIPYADLPSPLLWTDATGQRTQVKSFGVPDHDPISSRKGQVSIHYSYFVRNDHQFVLNINHPSQPIQVWIAKVPRKASLSETLADIAQRCAGQNEQHQASGDMLEDESTLTVPEMGWRLMHSFQELVGKQFTSGPLRNGIITSATEDVELKLNRNGAEVKSESVIAGGFGGASEKHVPPSFIVNGPFLMAMWLRGAERPFLVVWVENDELLNTFHPYAKPAGR